MGNLKHDVGAVVRQFEIPGEFQHAEPYGSGHINNTYCALFQQADVPVRSIVQRINHNIFKNPVALMENVQRVGEDAIHALGQPVPVGFGGDTGGGWWRGRRRRAGIGETGDALRRKCPAEGMER